MSIAVAFRDFCESKVKPILRMAAIKVFIT
jgi:hypothetical protein